MSKESYEELLPTIEAISQEDTKIPSIPIDVLLRESANLEMNSKEDQQQLINVGIPQVFFDELNKRIGALSYAESLWKQERYTKEEAALIWTEKNPIALQLREELEHSFHYAFRKHEDLLAKVMYIEEGTSNEDLVQDLYDLAVLGESNSELLQAINFDFDELKKSASLSEEMGALLVAMNGERNDSTEAKRIRDKAYTYLREAVDEIREAGKYVFWKNPEKWKIYARE
ncbi:MAG: hypothetical protein HRT61_14495 [Ekhidna sp.]|nr:hypothetical protein [Ekhidna sp.]